MRKLNTPYYFTVDQGGKGTNCTIRWTTDGTAYVVTTPGLSPLPLLGQDVRDLVVMAINTPAGAARNARYQKVDHYNISRLQGHYSKAKKGWMTLGEFLTTGGQTKSTQEGLDLIDALVEGQAL